MCMKPTSAATVLAGLVLFAASTPAAAWPFGGDKPAAKPAATTPAATPAATASATSAATGLAKASSAERAAADRLDPVAKVAFWTRETTADPTDAEAGVALATALRAVGRWDEAADAADHVLGLKPKYGPALFELARAKISANQGFYAIKPLQAAAALDAKDARPWWLLGVAYEQNEQPDLARAAYEQALKLAPDSPAALSNYALFRATHGEPQAAEVMLRKAVAQPGASAAERQNLALVLGLEGKLGEAERLIRQDLPPEVANTNLAYLRAMSAAPAKPAAASSDHSWNALQASEAAQVKTPSR